MTLAIELLREPSLTVSQWEQFMHQARQAGAADDSPVAEVMSTGDDEVIHSYRVKVSGTGGAIADSVTLPAPIVYDLLFIVSQVAKSDGDVRFLVSGAEETIQTAYDHLLFPVLGKSPFKPDPDEE